MKKTKFDSALDSNESGNALYYASDAKCGSISVYARSCDCNQGIKVTTLLRAKGLLLAVMSATGLMAAGCGGGGGTDSVGTPVPATPSTPAPTPAPAPAPAPAPVPPVAPTAPQIVADVQSMQALVGEVVTFSVKTAQPGASFQWYRNGAPMAGETADQLNLASVALADDNSTFFVRVSQNGQSVNSSSGTLSVREAATRVSILADPVERVVAEGESTQMTVRANGTALTYQWYLDDRPITGATGSSYQIAAATPDLNQRKFSVVVSNPSGSVWSRAAQLLVVPGIARTPVTGHPRLWIRQQDLPTLQSWAVASNPLFGNGSNGGLLALANTALARVSNGTVPGQDNGGSTYTPYATESYAALLAFMGLIERDSERQKTWRAAAKQALFAVIDEADKGVGAGKFRSASFASSDRGRWSGEAFPLAVDWLYSELSPAERARVRRVFLRWCQENVSGYPDVLYYNTNRSLVPTGSARRNHPSLLDLSDPKRRAVRYAMNNYLMAHARNIFMMANSIDPQDDVADPFVANDWNGRLGDYMHEAIGTYLYMTDYAYKNDGFGGLSPEGAEYGESIGFYYQLMLSMATSGYDDVTRFGSKSVLQGHPLFSRLMPGFFHALTTAKPQTSYGRVFQPSWFGDGEQLYFQAPTRVIAPHILASRYSGNATEERMAQWLLATAPPNHDGQQAALASAANHDDDIVSSIQYFLSFPPGYSSATDPRRSLPTWLYTPSLGRLQARTTWTQETEARIWNYKLSHNTIDHQHGDGNTFDFWRKGEWLTKEFSGYGRGAALSEFKNTLTIQNSTTGNFSNYHRLALDRGSQYILGAHDGDPAIVEYGAGADYVVVTGDATNLYNHNSSGVRASDVAHASRSVVWLQPDTLIVFDRADSKVPDRYKRFHLQLPNNGTAPARTGDGVVARTPGGQQLVVTTLLPTGNTTVVGVDQVAVDGSSSAGLPAVPEFWKATLDPMFANNQGYRLRVEDSSRPMNARFLHVLQGQDAGAVPLATASLQSASGARFTGAVVGSTLVLFADNVYAEWSNTTVVLPNAVNRVLLLGATPGQAYSVTRSAAGLTIRRDRNGSSVATAAGVLDMGVSQ